MSTESSRTALARRLRALHVPGDPLVLPNVWDCASAHAVADAGFPVVATGSAAVALVLGYEDEEGTPAHEMLAAVARIARAVSVPVTADMERGYGLAPVELAERLAATGAVGCNLEDTDHRTGQLAGPDEQAAYIARLRAADPDLVINARTDCLLRGGARPAERLADTAYRARAYLEAGADCVYPIGALDEPTVEAVVEAVGGRPVNVLSLPSGPTPARLAELGVARISFGDQLHRLVQGYLAGLVTAVARGDRPSAGG
ncbi:isocitrate lyase/phosphoenolpyruvate mutase family protein [Streptomyces sp. ME01-24h]|nr:isocitrate lyase/phosphoenolpyruvate mutase family protein [Streptomyces sp. ME19-03-3]MDX3351986.1 isocitrate lyase/phosphoenolpyruvate mutase family protein [Streptomyces sp. ME01-24h]